MRLGGGSKDLALHLAGHYDQRQEYAGWYGERVDGLR